MILQFMQYIQLWIMPFDGVSGKICEILNLQNKRVLIPKKGIIQQLITYVPFENAEKSKRAFIQKWCRKT